MRQKKMLMSVTGCLLMALGGLGLTGCNADVDRVAAEPYEKMQQGSDEAESDKTRMVALVETQEQAEEIAQLYQMELVSVREGVAVYLTEDDPQELIKLGEENGYPTISADEIKEIKVTD